MCHTKKKCSHYKTHQLFILVVIVTRMCIFTIHETSAVDIDNGAKKKNRKGWHMYCLKLSLQVLELSMECDPMKKMTVNLLTSDCLGTFDMLYGLLHPKLEDIHT